MSKPEPFDFIGSSSSYTCQEDDPGIAERAGHRSSSRHVSFAVLAKHESQQKLMKDDCRQARNSPSPSFNKESATKDAQPLQNVRQPEMDES